MKLYLDIVPVVLGLSIILTLASCTMPDHEELVGEWTPCGEPPYIVQGGWFKEPLELTKTPRIILNEDSTIVFFDVPDEIIGCSARTNPFAVSTRIISGNGIWYIEDKWGRAITLQIKEINGESTDCWTTSLHVETWFGEIELFVWLGDPDSGDRFSFEKHDSK